MTLSHLESHAAHDLSHEALGGQPIRIQGDHFVDAWGRNLLLRGVNISGASKLPTVPNGLSHLSEGFFDHRTVSFIGRPFPLQDAPIHFARLREWGLPLVRLLVTWESIAHQGPDEFDEEYMEYLANIVRIMPEYGIKCFVCPHQDVWSRFSGGSGAPGWTFEAAGLDIRAFPQTGAAYVHNLDDQHKANAPENEREPSGPFVWPSGYQKLAAATMATLFWAGETFAPKLRCRRRLNPQGEVEEVSIQEFLQGAYLEAFGRLSQVLAPLQACVGFEFMNEPHRGYINLHSFHKWNYETDLHIGHYPSMIESLALGSGYAQTIPYYVKSWPFPTRVSHRSRFDPKGRSAWLESVAEEDQAINRPRGLGQCIWRAHGVWDWNEERKAPVVLQNRYFETDPRQGKAGAKVEFYRDFYAPLVKRFSERIRASNRDWLMFVEPIPNEFLPPWPSKEVLDSASREQGYAVKTLIETERPENLVYAPHFYDLNVLFSKVHSWMSVDVQGLSRGMFILKALYFGFEGLKKNYLKQLSNVSKYATTSLGPVPVLVGEVGIPYDINSKTSYRTGDYTKQIELMDALICGLEENLISFTLWNYNPDHTEEHGDGWNLEDFSVFSLSSHPPHGKDEDDQSERHYRGGRALQAILRPYAVKVAGRPYSTKWDGQSLEFSFQWFNDTPRPPVRGGRGEPLPEVDKSQITEIYLPSYHYKANEFEIRLTDGDWSFDAEVRALFFLFSLPLSTFFFP
ncbi:glycoside hydrolase family 5 protein [Violaceomyces palustris]|uniref:Glycoside hydrolase family 5 protein n=1 Tax=Violaceomyces palustris TaxID=1673888 RepID=A0ACD0NTI2_9BASI|nr:glycoside hydrolase family 5 protein [Violaceomyces palustris]